MINDAYDDAFMMHMKCMSMLNTMGVTILPLKGISPRDFRITNHIGKNRGKVIINKHLSPMLYHAHRGDSTILYTS
jgi:hypothetical protein